ncbi:MAG: FlgD immunoglobulin-like domain containing protein, partial [Bacteroidales bacterium]|nr:FlgD immunoglobulin-like domain containing protein [Bacteroidales bacterium]
DLAGNPRVYNGYVDMGAYEYGPWVGIEHYNSKPNTQNSKLLDVFPNPFSFETTISYLRPEFGQCIIRIYDLNGRCVKTLMNSQGLSGKGEMKWRGTDDSGNPVKTGTYIVAIHINGKEMDAVKVVKK